MRQLSTVARVYATSRISHHHTLLGSRHMRDIPQLPQRLVHRNNVYRVLSQVEWCVCRPSLRSCPIRYHDPQSSHITTSRVHTTPIAVPVHDFLLRHVYLDSQRAFRLPPGAAIALTFGVSIAAHEVALWAALRLPHRFVPWLAVMSLAQFPLAALMKSRTVNGKRLGNLLFWGGLTFGFATLWVLYARMVATAQAANAAGPLHNPLVESTTKLYS